MKQLQSMAILFQHIMTVCNAIPVYWYSYYNLSPTIQSYLCKRAEQS